MKIYFFLFIFAFAWINVYLFQKIKRNIYDLAVLNKVDTPTVTALLNPKKKQSIKSLFKEYFRIETK
jgi:hypothetical protein